LLVSGWGGVNDDTPPPAHLFCRQDPDPRARATRHATVAARCLPSG
jgi:hypothetical protein